MEIEEKTECLRKWTEGIPNYVNSAVREVAGRKHIVLATNEDPSTIVDYRTPTCELIEKEAKDAGLRVAILPFECEGHVAYDIVVRGDA